MSKTNPIIEFATQIPILFRNPFQCIALVFNFIILVLTPLWTGGYALL